MSHFYYISILDSPFQEFLMGAVHGVAYFSFGTYLRTDEIPQEKMDVIIETFRNIKQRVLWKIDGKIPDNLPSNVLARSWFGQSDFLNHHKIVLFITHGTKFEYLV